MICYADESNIECSWRLGKEALRSYEEGRSTEAALLALEASDLPEEHVSGAAEYALQKATFSYIGPDSMWLSGGKTPVTNLYQIGEFQVKDKISDYYLDEKGDMLTIICENGSVTYWDVKTHKQTGQIKLKHNAETTEIQYVFDADGNFIVYGSSKIACYDKSRGTELWSIQQGDIFGCFSDLVCDTTRNLLYVFEEGTKPHIIINSENGEIITRKRFALGRYSDRFGTNIKMSLSTDGRKIYLMTVAVPGISEGAGNILCYSIDSNEVEELTSFREAPRYYYLDEDERLYMVVQSGSQWGWLASLGIHYTVGVICMDLKSGSVS